MIIWMKLGSETNLWLSFAGNCEELAQFPVYSMDSLIYFLMMSVVSYIPTLWRYMD
jgi:hypothetical protein